MSVRIGSSQNNFITPDLREVTKAISFIYKILIFTLLILYFEIEKGSFFFLVFNLHVLTLYSVSSITPQRRVLKLIKQNRSPGKSRREKESLVGIPNL